MRSTMLQLGTAAMVIGGFVVLTLQGADTAEYVSMIAPILAAVFVIQRLDQRQDQQDQVLGQIHENTNGVLDERIRAGVREALDQRNNSPSS